LGDFPDVGEARGEDDGAMTVISSDTVYVVAPDVPPGLTLGEYRRLRVRPRRRPLLRLVPRRRGR
jgi:hypothetical protein